jgi:hypothetical protein
VPDNGESTSIALYEYHGKALTSVAAGGYDEEEEDWSNG